MEFSTARINSLLKFALSVRVEIKSPKIWKTLYYVSSASCQNHQDRDKVKAIHLCDGGKSCLSVVEEMGDVHTQIMNILKSKREILDDLENNVPNSRKRQHRVTGNENIYKLCWDWFQDFVY
jgi:hypothetical protein